MSIPNYKTAQLNSAKFQLSSGYIQNEKSDPVFYSSFLGRVFLIMRRELYINN